MNKQILPATAEQPWNLKDKIALVTGGGSGIGRATCIALAQSGSHVVVAGRRPEAALETVDRVKELNREAIFVRTDVSKEAEVKSLVEATIEKFGRLDCAFNNAGFAGVPTGLIKTTDEFLSQIIDTNLKGTFFCMKHQLSAMINQRSGVIVNMGSINGTVAQPGTAAYSATKGAIIALTRTASVEYAKFGIRINAVSPGAIDTEMLAPLPKEVMDRITAAHPIGRAGLPEEVASAVVWLCSDAASFITGHNLLIDGGYTAQ